MSERPSAWMRQFSEMDEGTERRAQARAALERIKARQSVPVPCFCLPDCGELFPCDPTCHACRFEADNTTESQL